MSFARMVNLSSEFLIQFEQEIAELFNAGQIKAPVHLAGGNETYLIKYFNEHFEVGDWVFSTWRSHYHALLTGVPPELVKASILAGRSITLCFPEYNFFSSAIVGGHLPIALGVALAIKRSGNLIQKVHAFCGDMASGTGIYHEVLCYARGHALPLIVVTENNGKSVCTDTAETWGTKYTFGLTEQYHYKLPWPHSGAGKRVNF